MNQLCDFSSLAGTITSVRPDIPLHTNTPVRIPSHSDFQVPFMLSTRYNTAHDPTNMYEPSSRDQGWWISEKYDGIRARWMNSRFISRNSKPLVVPEFISSTFPCLGMDGEMWFGYGRLADAMKVSQRAEVNWKSFKYMVFDAPEVNGAWEGDI